MKCRSVVNYNIDMTIASVEKNVKLTIDFQWKLHFRKL